MGALAKCGIVAAAVLGAVKGASVNSTNLPIVDLGYEIHRASSFNATGNFYNFSNIRYAAPPLGNLRFAQPEAPARNRSVINNGTQGRICPQASPAWGQAAGLLVAKLLIGVPTNGTEAFTPPALNWSSPVPTPDPRVSEDCLFLDVFVPAQILNATTNSTNCTTATNSTGAPVLVWFFGGGYTSGDKYWNPSGLLAASGDNDTSEAEVIYVSFNYRLGSLGFLSGPSFQAEGGTSNLAFYDQRFALEWVQEHIHKFGGDPNRVTIFGESAGGGSIMHQITAYGGSKGPGPFQQAISQSAGWPLESSQLQQEDAYQALLELTNSTSLADLRKLSTEDMQRANYLQIYSSQYSTYTFGPSVDGDFVPLQPAQLLAQGRFDKNVTLMVGHNELEGTYFTPPINSEADIATALNHAFPYMPAPSVKHLTTVLYPPVFNGSHPYTSQFERASLLISEAIFTCNTYYLDTGFGNKTYSYLFNVSPALHSFDVPYTYYDGGAISSSPLEVTNRTVAIALQEFITSFAVDGKPSAPGVTEFRMYGPDARVLELNATSIAEVRDDNANERCNWWQKALYS